MKATASPVTASPYIKMNNNLKLSQKLSVEYFHIYTDEEINGRHKRGLDYLKTIEKSWQFKYDKVILIDNYNPTNHILDSQKVLDYLDQEKMLPDFWAYEGDLIKNAEKLLNNISSNKIRRSYEDYINKNKKYPCSLLTASWYLTRLGRLDYNGVIKNVSGNKNAYTAANKLINILPQDYKEIEKRAFKVIKNSIYKTETDNIQDLFYPTDSGRALELF